MDSLTQKQIDEFWGKVDKTSSPIFYNETRCWIWTGGHTAGGYGQLRVGKKRFYAHRFSYILNCGDLSPERPFALHHCDNPSCVRPDHLFSGTNKDNSDDKVHKGRQAKLHGESHGSHKLTDAQVLEIRRLYAWYGKGGKTQTELAREFGVSSVQIHKIVNRKSRA